MTNTDIYLEVAKRLGRAIRPWVPIWVIYFLVIWAVGIVPAVIFLTLTLAAYLAYVIVEYTAEDIRRERQDDIDGRTGGAR